MSITSLSEELSLLTKEKQALTKHITQLQHEAADQQRIFSSQRELAAQHLNNALNENTLLTQRNDELNHLLEDRDATIRQLQSTIARESQYQSYRNQLASLSQQLTFNMETIQHLAADTSSDLLQQGFSQFNASLVQVHRTVEQLQTRHAENLGDVEHALNQIASILKQSTEQLTTLSNQFTADQTRRRSERTAKRRILTNMNKVLAQ